jgi:hypothetical protein
MSSERDSNGEMHGNPIDKATADRLLAGMVSPEDAPRGYAGLAAMIQAATGPASPTELAREAAFVAAGVAAVTSTSATVPALARRQSMLAKLLSAKLAAAAVIAVLGAGTAAAAMTGSLPTQTSNASPHAKTGLAIATSHLPTGTAATTITTTSTSTSTTTNQTTTTTNQTATATGSTSSTTAATGTGPVGGMANGNATFGLCTAFLAGSGSSGKDSSTAFKTLIAANGGSVSATTAFCKTYVASNHPGHTTTTTTAPTASTTARTKPGRPASPGQSSSHVPGSIPSPNGHSPH